MQQKYSAPNRPNMRNEAYLRGSGTEKRTIHGPLPRSACCVSYSYRTTQLRNACRMRLDTGSQETGLLKQIPVGPVNIAALTPVDALRILEEMISRRKSGYVCFCEVNLLAKAHRDPRIADVLNGADMTFADGVCVLKLARASGRQLPARVPGPTFFLQACQYGIERGWRHFFYGGVEGVAERLAAQMRGRFPGINIAGTYTPPFRTISELAESDGVLRQIEETKPDLMWIALGGPKQEIWMAEHQKRISVPVMLGVGAAFDFHSGSRPWAPAVLRYAGLEWVWRMFTGGPAMFKRNIVCVTIVVGMILRAWFRSRFGARTDA